MSNKTRSILKITAIVFVLLAVVMRLGYVSIPALHPHLFWMVVIAFALLLIGSK
ncbi:MAG: hypothetical protein ACK5OS_10935 [Chryseotalea sp.]|jgi:hypothetical protein